MLGAEAGAILESADVIRPLMLPVSAVRRLPLTALASHTESRSQPP